jgi:hypothetical protein
MLLEQRTMLSSIKKGCAAVIRLIIGSVMELGQGIF